MTNREIFLEEALALGDRLAGDALAVGDRRVWLSREVPDAPIPGFPYVPTLLPMNAALAKGTAGMALFFSRLYAVGGKPDHREVARGAMRHALDAVRVRSARLNPTHVRGPCRLGFYFGGLGVAWTAVETGALVDDRALDRRGRALCETLLSRLDEPYEEDLMLGAAGAIPALLDLDRRGVPGALEKAILLGKRLVAKADRGPDGLSWKTSFARHGKNLVGFSHGASGIAWALAALGDRLKDDSFRFAAREAFVYERAHFDPSERNWPAYHAPPKLDGRHPCWNAWCHGAPGIGLSRALALPILRDDVLRQDLRIARETARAEVQTRMDLPGSDFQLCHGLSGVAECVWLMEEALGEPGAWSRAAEVGAYGIELFGQKASRRWQTPIDWPTSAPNGVEPSLLQGLAGVGLFLLRLHDPKVPSFLVPAAAAS